MDVRAGSEGFLSELGPWSVLGQKALGSEEYIPDFDARATGGCRMLRIHADAYRAALRMGKTDQIVGVRAMRQLTQVPASFFQWFQIAAATFRGFLALSSLWWGRGSRTLLHRPNPYTENYPFLIARFPPAHRADHPPVHLRGSVLFTSVLLSDLTLRIPFTGLASLCFVFLRA